MKCVFTGEGRVSPNDVRNHAADKSTKMHTSIAAAPRVRSTQDDAAKLKLPIPTTNNGLMMEVVSIINSGIIGTK